MIVRTRQPLRRPPAAQLRHLVREQHLHQRGRRHVAGLGEHMEVAHELPGQPHADGLRWRSVPGSKRSVTPSADQSIRFALSWVSQNVATSASRFAFRFLIDAAFLAAHRPCRDDTDAVPSHCERHKQAASILGDSKCDIALLVVGMLQVDLTQGLPEQDLFRFHCGDSNVCAATCANCRHPIRTPSIHR
jgi:hypothetical protein